MKLWEAETFSDGTALSEWAANRVASQPGHEALVQVLGTFEDRPKGNWLGGCRLSLSPKRLVGFVLKRTTSHFVGCFLKRTPKYDNDHIISKL